MRPCAFRECPERSVLVIDIVLPLTSIDGSCDPSFQISVSSHEFEARIAHIFPDLLVKLNVIPAAELIRLPSSAGDVPTQMKNDVEALVVTLILLIAASFAVEIYLSVPDTRGVLAGVVPRGEILRNKEMLYIAIGILGATVMPHNLYLHSSIVQTRKYQDDSASKWEAIRFATIDSSVALMSALFINGAILVVAAATFHGTQYESVADIGDAYKMLSPLLGTSIASTVFALALLFSGQNATLTGTLAGQIVMEGFINLRLRPWLRRLITRLIAIIPAIIVIVLYGERGTGPLLILSQVILSLQLPFAVFPLVQFTGEREKMGEFVTPRWVQALAWLVAVVIAALNAWLLYQTIVDLLS